MYVVADCCIELKNIKSHILSDYNNNNKLLLKPVYLLKTIFDSLLVVVASFFQQLSK